MKDNTIQYALHVLDSQMIELSNPTQYGYYEGMKAMFNIMVSGGYLDNYDHVVINDFTGLHELERVPKK